MGLLGLQNGGQEIGREERDDQGYIVRIYINVALTLACMEIVVTMVISKMGLEFGRELGNRTETCE